MHPQKIKITSNYKQGTNFYKNRNFCPIELLTRYRQLRGDYITDEEQFFVFRDHAPVTGDNTRQVLRNSLISLGLNPNNYGMHSFRSGRTTDRILKCQYSIEAVKRMGHWHSNVVCKYI